MGALKHRQRGFTLVEMMLAIALTAGLMAAALQLVPSITASGAKVRALAQLQLNAQAASQHLRTSLLRAGHSGCLDQLPSAASAIRIFPAGVSNWGAGHLLSNRKHVSSEAGFYVSYAVPPAIRITRPADPKADLTIAAPIHRHKDGEVLLITDCSHGVLRPVVLTKKAPVHALNMSAADIPQITGDLYAYRYISRGYWIRKTSRKGRDGRAINALYTVSNVTQVGEMITGVAVLRINRNGSKVTLGLLFEDTEAAPAELRAHQFTLAGNSVQHSSTRAVHTVHLRATVSP